MVHLHVWRDGDAPHNVCGMQEDFEGPFLEETRQFYRAESQDYISKNTCPDYMRKVRRTGGTISAFGEMSHHLWATPQLCPVWGMYMRFCGIVGGSWSDMECSGVRRTEGGAGLMQAEARSRGA
jgi:hypothetical protein